MRVTPPDFAGRMLDTLGADHRFDTRIGVIAGSGAEAKGLVVEGGSDPEAH